MPTRKSFYGLPAPWNPGYAIPRAVMEEGLQRHAYTSAWLPRGTYDRTTDGTAGYQIPEYVREERTGRGAFTTAWAARGGPKVPHALNRHPVPNIVQKAMSGLGDIAEYILVGPPPPPPPKHVQQFGQRASAAVLQQVNRVPPAQRGKLLSSIMRRMDPALESRTAAEVSRARAEGVPHHRVLQVGLGRAMSSGMMTELVRLGKHRVTPSRTSLLGLGVYQELGAIPGATGAPGTPGKDGAVGTGAGRKLRLDGDLLFDYKEGATIHVTPSNGAITQKRAKAIADQLVWWMTKQPGLPVGVGNPPYTILGGGTGLTYCNPGNHHGVFLSQLFGSLVDPKLQVCDMVFGVPVYKWTPPGGGADWAVMIKNVAPIVNGKVSPGFDLVLKRWNTQLLPSIGRTIKNVAGGVENLVEKAVDKVGDLACGMIHQPGFAQGAAATNPAAGVGVVVAAGMCGPGSIPPPVPPPPAVDSGLTKTLLIGGAALAGIAILTKKKKTEP